LQCLSAAESASLQLTLSLQNLAVLAEEAASNLADCFNAADVVLNQRLTEVYVMCDSARMREVISNLLTNALKFTQPGGSVALTVGPDGNGMASIRVSDTGIGIPRGDLPHVTDRFFRSACTAEMAGGSGIGLTPHGQGAWNRPRWHSRYRRRRAHHQGRHRKRDRWWRRRRSSVGERCSGRLASNNVAVGW